MKWTFIKKKGQLILSSRNPGDSLFSTDTNLLCVTVCTASNTILELNLWLDDLWDTQNDRRTLQLAKQASTPPTWQESAIAGAIIATTVNTAAVNLNCIYRELVRNERVRIWKKVFTLYKEDLLIDEEKKEPYTPFILLSDHRSLPEVTCSLTASVRGCMTLSLQV